MNYFDLMIRRSRNAEPPAPAIPDDEVWYYAPEQVTLYSETNVVSHTFSDGKGIVKYSAPLTEMPNTLKMTDITYANMPNSIKRIATGAFEDCPNLTDVRIPNGVTYIGSYAFQSCAKLSLTYLPASLTEVGSGTFSGCHALALKLLPNGLKHIGTWAFEDCYNMTFTKLPDAIDTSISPGAFYSCTNIALTSLPEGILAVAYKAFWNCTKLALNSTTSMPSTLNNIDEEAFAYCSGLTSITLRKVPEVGINAQAFTGCTNLTDIYVPWYEGDVANAPWGATNATVHYKDASISIDSTMYSMYVGIGGTASFTYSCTEPVTFAVEQGYTLPSGITLSGNTFKWDGTTPKGSYSIVIRGTSQHNPTGSTATMTFNVAVISYVRFAAGVDTTLYLTNNNGVFTATPSGDWGGTGYHGGISGTWVSFYPKHGVKYSLDGGTTYLDWCFEDTNATLDLSAYFTGNIISVTKVSGRDSVTLSGNQITVNDPSSSSAIYVFDVEMTTVDESSSSDVSDSSSSDISDSSSSGSSSGGIPTDYVFYAPLVDKNESTAVTGQTLTYSGTINNDVIDSKTCLHLINGNIKMTDTTVIPTGRNPFTQSIWFYIPEWQKCGVFTHGVNSTYGSIHIQCKDTQNQLDGGGWYLDYTITSSLSIGQWHHVVQTYDGTQFASYIDGVPMTTFVNSNVNVQAGNIAIGCQPTGGEASRNIYVRKAILYSRVLTSDEISAIYNEG